MTTSKIDFNKPLRTIRDKSPVRIICTDKKGVLPVVGLVELPYGEESLCCFDKDGSSNLENIPERKEFYCNIYLLPNGNLVNGWTRNSIQECNDKTNGDPHVGYTKHTVEDGKVVAVEFIPLDKT